MGLNRGGAPPAAAAEGETFAAPLLAECLAPAVAGERLAVLDLGPGRAENVAFLSRYRCRLGIADLIGERVRDANFLEAPEADAALEELLPERLFHGPQVILCWDLLDYLAAHGIRCLGARLRALSGPDTVLHALVAYGAARIPARPTGYELREGGVQPVPAPGSDPGQRPPRISSGELQRLLPDWRIQRSVLLRNGLQEYAFVCG